MHRLSFQRSAAALSLVVVAALGGACSSPKPQANQPEPDVQLAPATCGALERLHVFGGIYLAGQPSSEDFAALKDAGVKTVVNIRAESELKGFDERARVESLGMKYVSKPWSSPAQLTDAVFDEYRRLLSESPRPMALHCGSANRVGAVWIPWRVLDGGIALEDAVVEAKTIGLRSPELEALARDYVARRKQ